MNKEELQQKIAEYYGKLPKEAQIVFSSMTWMETLKDIGVKYSLNNNQIETLGTETTLVLLGIIHIEEYQKILEKELGLEKEITEKIIIEIDENILKTIKDALSKTFEANAISLAEKEAPVVEKVPEFDPRFMSMPKEVEEAIAKSNWKEKLYEIAGKYKLTVEQMGALEEMTVKVISNEVHPDKYEEELASKITIAKEDVSNLVKDINEGILKKIRENEKGSSEKEKVIMNEDEVPLPPYAKKDVLKDAWPVKNINIIEEKLKGVTVSDRIVSDHSLPKIKTMSDIKKNDLNPGAKTHDPYREPF